MSGAADQPAVGFIGPGDRGLPIATAVAEAGYPLHAGGLLERMRPESTTAPA